MRAIYAITLSLLVLVPFPLGAEVEVPIASVSKNDRIQLLELNEQLIKHGVVPLPSPGTNANDFKWMQFAKRVAYKYAPRHRDSWTERPLAPQVEALIPRHRRYTRLQNRLIAVTRTIVHTPIHLKPAPYRVAVGITAPEVGKLRQRLALDGYGSIGVKGRLRNFFDHKLKQALWKWQRRHKLPLTTYLDDLTRLRLNRSLHEPVSELLLALKRWRQLSLRRDEGKHVIAHLNRYRLTAWDHDRIALNMPVVIGKRRGQNKTRAFSSILGVVTANPKWFVPERIVRETLLPKVKGDHRGLQDLGFQVKRRSQNQWSVTQRPGPTNPLGRLAFRLPSGRGIFLHDTPDKKSFSQRVRRRSHGCIRVSQAEQLARWALGETVYTQVSERLQQGWSTKHFRPPHAVNVHLVYQTLSMDSQGRLIRHPDIYRKDRRGLRKVNAKRYLTHARKLIPEAPKDGLLKVLKQPQLTKNKDHQIHGLPLKPLTKDAPESLGATKGRYSILVLMDTGSAASMELLTGLHKVSKTLSDDIVVLGIAMNKASIETVKQGMKKPPVPFFYATAALRSGNSVLGNTEHVPTTWIVNRLGIPLFRYEGAYAASRVIEKLKTLLRAEGVIYMRGNPK